MQTRTSDTICIQCEVVKTCQHKITKRKSEVNKDILWNSFFCLFFVWNIYQQSSNKSLLHGNTIWSVLTCLSICFSIMWNLKQQFTFAQFGPNPHVGWYYRFHFSFTYISIFNISSSVICVQWREWKIYTLKILLSSPFLFKLLYLY